VQTAVASAAAVVTLPPLSIVRARVTMRMLEPATLPPYKGAMLRGGFGYAFQRATSACPTTCWGHADACNATLVCPYRQYFEPERVAQGGPLHDLRDIPRAFVIEPPLDERRSYAAGDALEFGLVLIGKAIDVLPNFLYGFAELGRSGLGAQLAKARLEHAAALRPFQHSGLTIFADDEAHVPADPPTYNLAELPSHAARLPADLRLTFQTPLRVKSGGAFIEHVDLAAIVQAACWRLAALTRFYGDRTWDVDYQPIVAAARRVRIERAETRWFDWERTSTRGGGRRSMKLGGLIGGVSLREVPLDVRTVLLAASLLHVGKATVFGHGQLAISHM
jgi:hypothetical protein